MLLTQRSFVCVAFTTQKAGFQMSLIHWDNNCLVPWMSMMLSSVAGQLFFDISDEDALPFCETCLLESAEQCRI